MIKSGETCLGELRRWVRFSYRIISLLANDSTAMGIIDNLGIGLYETRGVASSIVSIKVSAIKPLGGIIKIHENLT